MSEGSIGSSVDARIAEHREQLSPTERRVAAVVLDQPELVAFGTVARVAEMAEASGASVVRLAARLGYSGFTDLQAAVQRAIGQQLRPAAERIQLSATHRRPDLVARTLQADLDNVEQTLRAVTPKDFDQATSLLAVRSRPVRILAGDAMAGLGAQLAAGLALLRPDVAVVEGSDVAVARQLAALSRDTNPVLVAIDLRRYERWVVQHARRAARAGADVIAITDSVLSPLAAVATVSFTVRAEGAGPFDSLVGALSLTNALVSGVAGRLRRNATPRLAAVEDAWRATNALLDP
ncbi:MAG TPA: MurR/RpiR family transcriptional regulator [Acidimicrobiales bacterium]|jgi:DNA-binding MurR/RpiR family transcriptional regulator